MIRFIDSFYYYYYYYLLNSLCCFKEFFFKDVAMFFFTYLWLFSVSFFKKDIKVSWYSIILNTSFTLFLSLPLSFVTTQHLQYLLCPSVRSLLLCASLLMDVVILVSNKNETIYEKSMFGRVGVSIFKKWINWFLRSYLTHIQLH